MGDGDAVTSCAGGCGCGAGDEGSSLGAMSAAHASSAVDQRVSEEARTLGS